MNPKLTCLLERLDHQEKKGGTVVLLGLISDILLFILVLLSGLVQAFLQVLVQHSELTLILVLG